MTTERPMAGVPTFDRAFFGSCERFSGIGNGELGGKARGLAAIREFLSSRLDRAKYPGVEVEIPTSAVIMTKFFGPFMARNGLADIAFSDLPDERIASDFQKADLGREEYDGTLKHTASAYNARSDRLTMEGGNPGPRVINFAPLLTLGNIPFNELPKGLAALCIESVDAQVEIEFAAVLEPPVRFGFLQVVAENLRPSDVIGCRCLRPDVWRLPTTDVQCLMTESDREQARNV
jgi:hypothetical protein